MCCNVCEVLCPYTELVFPSCTPEVKKRRPRVRSLLPENANSLQLELLGVRDRVIAENPAFRMVPKSVVCPVSVIKLVTSRSSSIKCIEDFHTIPGLRKQFHAPFLQVFQCVYSLSAQV